MANIKFKPKQTTKKLLSVLPDRAREVLISRYGLGKNTSRMTLDAIGKNYGITRERVRQILKVQVLKDLGIKPRNARKYKQYIY